MSHRQLNLLRPRGRRRSIARNVLPASGDRTWFSCIRIMPLSERGSGRRDYCGISVPISSETSRTLCFLSAVRDSLRQLRSRLRRTFRGAIGAFASGGRAFCGAIPFVWANFSNFGLPSNIHLTTHGISEFLPIFQQDFRVEERVWHAPEVGRVRS